MSEATVLVPIFPYAAEGGARPSSYFRQGNWESETKSQDFWWKNCAAGKIYETNCAARKICLTESWCVQDFFDWMWTNCISLRERWNKVRVLRNHSETRWNKVRALRNHSEERVGCRQPTEPQWTVITFSVLAVGDEIFVIDIMIFDKFVQSLKDHE